MPKSYDDIIEEVEIDYDPSDYLDYEDFISDIREGYGNVVDSLEDQIIEIWESNQSF